MINFTGVLRIGDDYVNTQSVNDWHFRKITEDTKDGGCRDTYGTQLICRDGRSKFIADVSPEDFYDKFEQAEQTGFSVVA